MSSEREFDVVIFGATGFTGKLVAEYFQAQYGNDSSVKWAVAGRSYGQHLTKIDRKAVKKKQAPRQVTSIVDPDEV